MGTLLAGTVWAITACLGVLCLWRAWHCLPAEQRRQSFRQGRPQLTPIDWIAVASVAFFVAGLAGYAMLTDWAAEMLDPLLAPLVRR